MRREYDCGVKRKWPLAAALHSLAIADGSGAAQLVELLKIFQFKLADTDMDLIGIQ